MYFFWGTSTTSILIQRQFLLYWYLTRLYWNKATPMWAALIKIKKKIILQIISKILNSIY